LVEVFLGVVKHGLNAGSSLFYEEDIRGDGSREQRAYLTAPTGTIAVHTTHTDASGNPAIPSGAQANPQNLNPSSTTPDALQPSPYTLTYWVKDHLGSITVTTDERGQIKERLRFDPWGKPMTALGGVGSKARTGDRGFTEHEHLAGGLIHMNGRVYDPVLGRFLSTDIIVQFPDAITSYNRYGYVMNNPLAYTDPSGYFIVELITVISTFLAANAGTIALTALAASGVAAATGHLTAARRFLGAALMFTGMYMAVGATAAQAAWWTVGTAFAAGGIQSGSLEGAVLAGMSAGIGMGIGEIISLANAGAFAQVENVAVQTASFQQTAGGGSFADSVRRMAEAQGMGLRAVADTAPAQLEKVVITASERAAAMNPYVQQDRLFDVGALYVGMALSRAITSSAARAAIRANQTTVRELKVPRNIHDGQQGKHRETHNNYDPNRGRSVLTSDPQTLLNEVHSGVHSVDVMSANKATVDFGKAIGKYYDNGVLVGKTTRGTIHFGSQGAHIVPARPELLIPK
jgi:RHS repeat-associated protein